MNSYEGVLLVASPYLQNSFFARSVILILQHNAEGAIGVVLNHPSAVSAEELWRRLSRAPCPVEGTVSVGGPVAGSVVVLRSDWLSGAGSTATAQRMAARATDGSRSTVRMFAGHAQWNPGQLEQEIERGYWLTQPANPHLIFAERDQVWVQALKQIGQSVLAVCLDFDRMPPDPSVN